MTDEQAKLLRAGCGQRMMDELAVLVLEPIDELSSTDLADDASDLYQEGVDAGRIDELRDQLAAVERAEERLRDGRDGLSIESGEPIPDERLEVRPDGRAHRLGGGASRARGDSGRSSHEILGRTTEERVR